MLSSTKTETSIQFSGRILTVSLNTFKIVPGSIISFKFIPVVYILRKLSPIIPYFWRKMYRLLRVMMLRSSNCCQIKIQPIYIDLSATTHKNHSFNHSYYIMLNVSIRFITLLPSKVRNTSLLNFSFRIQNNCIMFRAIS